jgi:hypothetical protein
MAARGLGIEVELNSNAFSAIQFKQRMPDLLSRCRIGIGHVLGSPDDETNIKARNGRVVQALPAARKAYGVASYRIFAQPLVEFGVDNPYLSISAFAAWIIV